MKYCTVFTTKLDFYTLKLDHVHNKNNPNNKPRLALKEDNNRGRWKVEKNGKQKQINLNIIKFGRNIISS
jgi:hypothetical protein